MFVLRIKMNVIVRRHFLNECCVGHRCFAAGYLFRQDKFAQCEMI